MRAFAFLALVATFTTASACSFYAFDDYSDSSGAADAADATEAASASGDASPNEDAPPTEAGSHDPYGDVIRADAPVAWYRFEEDPIANAAKDSVGSRTANLIGGAMGFGAQGISGRGIATNGSGGKGFTIGNELGFAGATPFSLEIWVKPTPRTMEHYVFHKRESVDGSLRGFIVYLTPTLAPRFEDWGTKMSGIGDDPVPSGWVHLVATVSMTNGYGEAKIWVNGQPQPKAFGEDGAMTPATSIPFTMLSNFDGDADEIAIYDKALSPERILAHYLAGKQ